MTRRAPRSPSLPRVLLLLALAAQAPGLAAQETPASAALTPVGLVGGSRVEGSAGASVSAGGIVRLGPLVLSALGEGHFFEGRPDERFQERQVLVAYAGSPADPFVETWCQDPATGEVFLEAACRADELGVAALLDMGLARRVAGREVILGGGYRLGHGQEPYALVAVTGRSGEGGGAWVARLTVGARTLGLQLGYAP